MRHKRNEYNGKARPLRKGPECHIISHAVRPSGRCVGGSNTCAGLRVLQHPQAAAFLFSMSNYTTGPAAMQGAAAGGAAGNPRPLPLFLRNHQIPVNGSLDNAVPVDDPLHVQAEIHRRPCHSPGYSDRFSDST